MTQTPTDEALMDAYVAGDEAAFETLFRRYAGLVLGYMRKGYVGVATAEDLTQQVFLQLHRARLDYQSGRPLRPWLMTIARNLKRDFLRREARRPPPLPLEDREPGAEDRRRTQYEERQALRHALDRLPASLRSVVVAHWLEHQPFGEVARRLGISRSAAKVRAHRAYRALRAILRDLDPGAQAGCSRDVPLDVPEDER